MTRHTSTVNLTVNLETEAGVPADVTALTIGALVSRAIADAVPTAKNVEARVSSAFIVRTDRSGEEVTR